MPATETSFRTTMFGQPAVLVEQPDGELLAYLIREEAPAAEERVAFTLTKQTGEAYRVFLSKVRGWTCPCGDSKWIMRKKRSREDLRPCKHVEAVQRWRAEEPKPCAT